jgi:hypothetical protein
MRLLACIFVLALALPSGASALTISWHTVAGGNWEGGGQFNPRA